ncbi:MAG: DUF2232 domain-containing protein [Candidatus Omnitrophica bacterium]|nr:DUF2232 domain-containing protein [Candidatus Omnitrophota bacterium]
MVGKRKIAHYLTALTLAVLFLFSLPHISFGKEIVFFLLPLPFIILAVLAPYPSLGINILLGLALSVCVGKKVALGFVLVVSLFSWVVGWLMHYSFRTSTIILIGIILGTLGTGLFFMTAGHGYLFEWRENFDQAAVDSFSYYKEQGVKEEKLALLHKTMNQLSGIIRKSFPAIIVITTTALVSFNYFLAGRLLANLGYRARLILSVSQWRIPDRFIWVFIAAFFSIWIGRAIPGMATPVGSAASPVNSAATPMALDFLYRIGLNLMILMLAAYLVQGFILVNFFLKKWNWPVFLRVLLYLLLVLQPLFLIAIILWGIFEVWFNFRKVKANREV